MSQDIIADTLNQIMNAKRARHTAVRVKYNSKFLMNVLSIGKLHGYVRDFRVNGKMLDIELGEKLNACLAIKPRYLVKHDEIMKYVRRYLPSRHMGIVVISTSQGLMAHHTAIEKGVGGSIVAYFY